MKATLIAVTQPVASTGISDAEGLVAYCARVSAPANQHKTDTAVGLLRYLIRERHWSPFEMVHAVVGLDDVPRDIARQILRHRSFAFQEFSQRYAEVLTFLRRAARRQDHKNRQNSTDDLPFWKRWLWAVMVEAVVRLAAMVYMASLRLDIAKECARVVLPEGLTPSRLYMAGSLRSFLHYLEVRKGNGTQREHVEIAMMIEGALREAFPTILDATK